MTLRRFILFSILVITGFLPLRGQLSGIYTIGGSPGTRNFSSWSVFADTWNKQGIANQVTVRVLKNDTINSAIQLYQHSTSPTQRGRELTILGNGFHLVGNFKREVLHLNGIDHVHLKNLVIENSFTQSSLLGIRFSNGADSNRVDSCSVVFSKLVQFRNDTGAYIAFTADTGRITRQTSKHAGTGNVIVNNKLYCSLSRSPGPFYGIYDQQGSADYTTISTHNRIDSNLISTFYSVGIYMRYINGELCRSNTITRGNCSSSSNTDTTLIGIFCLDGRSDNQAIEIKGNQIEHLPYKNASLNGAIDFIWNLYGINAWKLFGGGKRTVIIEDNRLSDFTYFSRFHGILSQYGEQISISKNVLYNIKGDRGYSFGIYSQLGDDVKMDHNVLRKIDFGSSNTGDGVLLFGYEMGSGTWGENTVVGNVLDSNRGYKELYSIATMWKGNWNISRNKVMRNYTVTPKGITVGIYFYYCVNMDIHDNVVAQNYGPAETYYIYSTNYNTNQNLNVFHNTLYDSIGNSNGHASAMLYLDDDSRTEVVGNIVEGKGTGDVYPMFLNTVSVLSKVKDNSIFVKGYSTENWAYEVNQYTNFQNWNKSGAQDSLTYWIPASFANRDASDYRSLEYRNQNNVASNTISETDVNGKSRHKIYTDRGAVIDSLNLSLFIKGAVPDTVCSGYVLASEIGIINGYVDTVFDIAISVKKNLTGVNFKQNLNILKLDTGYFRLTQPLRVDQWGWNDIWIFLSSSNDNTQDDTLHYRVYVKPAPGSSTITPQLDSSQSNIPIVGKDFDVVLLNTELVFSVSPPRSFSRTNYGKSQSWYAETHAFTQSGSLVKGSSLVEPKSNSDLLWKFSPTDTALEDSFVHLQLRIMDLISGCDTVIERLVYIEPTPQLYFKIDSAICSQDTLYIKNLTTIKSSSSYMRYFWNLGNGDTSRDYSPSCIYTDSGTYPIELSVSTSPYNFKFTYKDTIKVNPVPDISFTRGVACEGRSVQFENTSKSQQANFVWDFGDGTAYDTTDAKSVSHTYSKRSNYNVVLSGFQRGCQNKQSSRVSVFEQPKALMDFDTVICAGQSVSFNNKTQMSTAIFGVRWEFGENNNYSTQKNTTYRYDSAGLKIVKYTVKSEFGCIDSVSKNIQVKPSPKAQFSIDRLCKASQSRFENTTKQVPGYLWQLRWTLNGVDEGSKSYFTKDWIDTGVQKVSLKVQLDNGCSDSIIENIRVLEEIEVDFTFDINCAGDSTRFVNLSKPSAGIDFVWKWGNGEMKESFNHNIVFDATDSITFPVGLMASALNTCTTELIKQVPVLPRPRTCDFDYRPDYAYAYFGLALNPRDDLGELGGQSGITYTWKIENNGTFKTQGESGLLQYALPNDGSYVIEMLAETDAHGCRCSKEYTFNMNRMGVDLGSASLAIYPNPTSTDVFRIDGIKTIEHMFLFNLNGQKWPLTLRQIHSESFECYLPEIAAGMYYLEWQSDGKLYTANLLVTHP